MKKSTLAILLSSALLVGTATAHEAGSLIFRAGGVVVEANSTSKTKTPLEVQLEVNNNAQLGLTATYMLSDNLGIELLGATPFSHKIKAYVPALEADPKKADLKDVVAVKHLPPSLYFQYYFLDKDSPARPYVGAGVNYTRFFHAKSINEKVSNLQVKKHSFGPVINAGVDIKLVDNLYLNTALWYTQIKTNAKFKALGADHEVRVKLDPIVYFVGLGYKF